MTFPSTGGNAFDEASGNFPGSREVGRLSNGTMVGATYRVLDFIGEGGMGHVYKVEHTLMNRILALKLLKTEEMTDAVWKRFRNEAQAIARLDHRNVVKIYDMNKTEDGVPFYTMDLLVGESLADYVFEHGHLSLEQGLSIFRQVCSGLAFANSRGIIHRDIKPGNIMLIENGDKPYLVKIVDFGIAKMIDEGNQAGQGLTRPGEVFGSPLYMSPEQCAGTKLDARSDMYSVGVTMFQALTGKPPLIGRTAIETTIMHQSTPAPSMGSINPERQFPTKLEKIVARMLAKNPDDRYLTLAEVETELVSLQQTLHYVVSTDSNLDLFGSETYGQQGESGSDFQSGKVESTGNNGLSVSKKILIIALPLLCIGILSAAFFIVSRPAPQEQKKSLLSTEERVGTSLFSENMATALQDPLAPQIENNVADKDKIVIEKFLHQPFAYFARSKAGIVEYSFPTQVSLGTLTAVENGIKRKPVVARGLVSVPASAKIELKGSYVLTAFPRLFDYFRPDDLRFLILPRVDAPDASLMAKISRLKGLEVLQLPEANLHDPDLKYIESLPHLNNLNIFGTGITSKALAASPLLKRLNILNISRMQDPSPVISAMNSNMLMLWLIECPLNWLDYDKIAACKTLTYLDFAKYKTSDGELKKLATLQNLQTLNIDDCNQLTGSSLPTIISLRKLRLLKLPRLLFNKETVAKIHLTNPSVKIE